MSKSIFISSCGLVLLAAMPALAQNSIRSAGEKIDGQAYREFSTEAYSNGAYSHAAVLNDYSRRYSHIPAATAQEHTAEVRRNVTAAKKELTKLAPKAKDDKALAKHLDTLHGHYDKAIEHAGAVDKESANNAKADSKKLEASTGGLTDSLKAAQAEHKKLNEHLKTTEKK